MQKRTLVIVAAIAVLLASCSPAQVASGTFTGSYSASGVPSTSGTATVTVSENGANAVNIVASSSGNPDITANNVAVTKIAIPGITQVSFSLGGDVDVDGYVVETAGIKTISVSIDNNIDTTYISFSGTKL